MTCSRTLRLALGLTALAASAAIATPPAGASSAPTQYSFVSAPNLHPPKLKVLERKPGLPQGDFLVTNNTNTAPGTVRSGAAGPMILDSHIQPVWFVHPSAGVSDLQQETYAGHPVLVWVQGGEVVVVNERYRTIARLKAHPPWTIDGHDAVIRGGDVWVVVARLVKHQNLSRYGGPANGNVIDSGVQEYRLKTGHLIGTWDALNPGGKPNVPLSASKTRLFGRTWDPYHLNSVQPLPNGDLVLSMRDTWAVYLLNPSTGRILWTLGGKRSTFTFGHGARFALQHDAELVDPATHGLGSDVELTLFNDNRGAPSSGLVLRLNTRSHTATVVRAYLHQPALHAGGLGSMQLLPNGNALVGWGTEPYFSEYARSGQELLDVHWPWIDQSYRALFTDTWVGTPYYPPRGAAQGDTVYASWNGATQVARWQVLAGANASDLKLVATDDRTGFETAIKLSRTYGVYEVRALNARGRSLGTSKSFS